MVYQLSRGSHRALKLSAETRPELTLTPPSSEQPTASRGQPLVPSVRRQGHFSYSVAFSMIEPDRPSTLSTFTLFGYLVVVLAWELELIDQMSCRKGEQTKAKGATDSPETVPAVRPSRN